MKFSRIIISGISVEIATAVLRITWISISDYFVGRGPGNELNPMIISFFSETVGTSLFAILFGWWATRKNDSRFLVSGILIGLVAVAAFIVDCLVFQVPFHSIMIPLGVLRIVFALIGSIVSYFLFKRQGKRISP